jgi:hypothetical protein
LTDKDSPLIVISRASCILFKSYRPSEICWLTLGVYKFRHCGIPILRYARLLTVQDKSKIRIMDVTLMRALHVIGNVLLLLMSKRLIMTVVAINTLVHSSIQVNLSGYTGILSVHWTFVVDRMENKNIPRCRNSCKIKSKNIWNKGKIYTHCKHDRSLCWPGIGTSIKMYGLS